MRGSVVVLCAASLALILTHAPRSVAQPQARPVLDLNPFVLPGVKAPRLIPRAPQLAPTGRPQAPAAIDLLPFPPSPQWACLQSGELDMQAFVQNTHDSLTSGPGQLVVSDYDGKEVANVAIPPIGPRQQQKLRVWLPYKAGCSGVTYVAQLFYAPGKGPLAVRNGLRYLHSTVKTTRFRTMGKRQCSPRGTKLCPGPPIIRILNEAVFQDNCGDPGMYALSIGTVHGSHEHAQGIQFRFSLAWHGNPKYPRPNEALPLPGQFVLTRTDGGLYSRIGYPAFRSYAEPVVVEHQVGIPERLMPGRCLDVAVETGFHPPNQCRNDRYWDGMIVRICEELDMFQFLDGGTTFATPG